MDLAPKVIELTNDQVAIVDPDDYPGLMSYTWRAVKVRRSWYAKTTVGYPGHKVDLSMSRLIAMTKPDDVCHHLNFNSLDNRKSNLHNMSKLNHRILHTQNRIRVKFDR